MGFPFAAVAGAVLPGLIGGATEMSVQKKALKQQKKQFKQERKYYKNDRANERAYAEKNLARDRAYYQKMLGEGRQYSEGQTSKDRAYSERLTSKDRAYNRSQVRDDRSYVARRLREDRAYSAVQKAKDRAAYRQESERYNRSANRAAERTTASRGVDFQKLRDDAIAAGFNPLTAMSMAHAYSTETNYGAMASPAFGQDASYLVSGAGYTSQAGSGGGGGTGVVPSGGGGGGVGAPMSVAAPSGGFVSSGGGYAGPSLSAGSFVAEAVARGIDTWANTPDPREADYNNIMGQVQASLRNRQAQAETPRDFGFALSKVEPFRPQVGVLNPPFRGDGLDLQRKPVNLGGALVTPADSGGSADAASENYGDGVGEAVGAQNFINDSMKYYGSKAAWPEAWGGSRPSDKWGRTGSAMGDRIGPPVPDGTSFLFSTGVRPGMPPLSSKLPDDFYAW